MYPIGQTSTRRPSPISRALRCATAVGLLAALSPMGARAQVQLVDAETFANAGAEANRFSGGEISSCKDGGPDELAAACNASNTGELGGSATAAARASVAFSTTSAGVDANGNPLVSALTASVQVSASADATSVAGDPSNLMVAHAVANAGGRFIFRGTTGTPVSITLDVSGPTPPVSCSSSPRPGQTTFDDGELLTVDVSCYAPDLSGVFISGNGSVAETYSATLNVSFGRPSSGEVVWINPLGGGYGTAGNWDSARVPTAEDGVRFDLAGPYTVDLGGSRSVQRAVVHSSLLDLVGGTFDLLAASGGEPPLAIGDGATLTLANATVRAADIVIGDVAGVESMLRVADGGRLEPSNELRIGDVGPGTLEIVGGTIAGRDVSVGAPDDAIPVAASRATGAHGRGAAGIPLGRGNVTVRASALGNGVLKLEGTQRRVTVGDRGPGSIEVLDGGVLDNAGETIIGTSPGPADVLIDGGSEPNLRANWTSGGTATVGKDAVGTLDIVKAGSMRAPDMRIGAETGGDGKVTLDDVSEDLGVDGPLLDIADTLDVGDAGRGDLNVFGASSRVAAKRLRLGVSSGGFGQVSVLRGGTVSVTDLDVGVEGAGDLAIGTGDGGMGLVAGGHVSATTVNIAGAFGAPAIAEPSSVEVTGDDALLNTDTLLIGDRDLSTGVGGGVGSLRVSRGARLSLGTFVSGLVRLLNGELLLEDPGTILQANLPGLADSADIGVIGGQFVISNRALATADKVVVSGPLDPTFDTFFRQPTLAVQLATLQVVHTLNIGAPDDAWRRGTLQLDEGVVEVGDSVTCNPGCRIAGNGLLRIKSAEINLNNEVLTQGDFSPGHSPGTIRVEGNFRQGAAGRLVMEVAGLAPGAFDLLEATGQATLGGTLDVRFLDGFLPKQGDAVPFLTIGGKTAGTFDAVSVHGVAPGFDFAVGATDGTVTLTALNDAEPAACADPTDADADGQTCADNCPAIANADQADLDGDLAGDACDPCTHGVPIAKPTLTLKKGKLNLEGTIRLVAAPTLAPLTTGVRLVLMDATGAPVLDLTAPAGAFDKATKQGWKKRGFKSHAGPVTAVKLAPAKRTPELVKFSMKGLLGALDPGTIAQPMALTLLLDAAATPTGTCGEVHFTGPPAINPLCTLKGRALACKSKKKR